MYEGMSVYFYQHAFRVVVVNVFTVCQMANSF